MKDLLLWVAIVCLLVIGVSVLFLVEPAWLDEMIAAFKHL